MSFDHYLAFGDSISIDDYAGPGLGAASLLYRNADERWPDFRGRDLSTLTPNCRFHLAAADGATLEDSHRQLENAPTANGRVLVTLTVGGNDLLTGLGRDITVESWETSLRNWLARLRQRIESPTVVLANIYDPTDGTDRLPSGDESLKYLRPYFEIVNRVLERVALAEGALFVDVHAHFLRHALSEPAWIHCEIEPTAIGSSEVRRLFWHAIEAVYVS